MKYKRLNKVERDKLKLEIDTKRIDFLATLKELYELERQIDYDDLLNKGFSIEDIESFKKEDDEYLDSSIKKVLEYKRDSNNFFCFPTNKKINDTALINYLKILETSIPLLNACGDPFEESNFKLSNKDNERKIIDIVAKNVHIIKPYWGYITSGGTEGNLWGIREGKEILKKSKLYYSKASHYSINKIGTMLYDEEDIVNIDTYPNTEKINVELLINSIEENFKLGFLPNLLLTFGTTCSGDIDDFVKISKILISKNIPYYLHLDSAFFGGIPSNFKNAPTLTRENIIYINSLSISFHKFFGSPTINGILLSRNRTKASKIEYIGNQFDSTISGSRSFPPFSLYKRICDLLSRTKDNEYDLNNNRFTEELNKRNIPYIRYGYSNIYILKAPKNEILEKYQLETFNYENSLSIHIIITLNTVFENLNQLLDDISSDL